MSGNARIRSRHGPGFSLALIRPLTFEFAFDLAQAVDMREASARQPSVSS